MFWTSFIVFLAISQVPADLVTPDYVENVRSEEEINQRIVSGWTASPGQIPYQTSLRLVNPLGGVSGCGGSVVARDWVISAAHCTAGQISVVVRAGLVSLTTPQYIFETTEFYNHPTFNVNNPTVVQPNDISIIKLSKPVTYSWLLQPIRLQTSSEADRNYNNEIVVASGFGRTWTNGPQSEVLNWVYLVGLTNAVCSVTYGPHLINANAVCARYSNVTTQSTCQGDSGGPLVHVDSDGIPTLVGIASFVAGGEWGCHSGLPAGFIRPGPFLPWLKEITGLDFENLNEEEEEELPTTTELPITNSTTTELPITNSTTTELPITNSTTTELPTTNSTTTELPITNSTTTELPTTNSTTTELPTTNSTTTELPITNSTTTELPTTNWTITPTTELPSTNTTEASTPEPPITTPRPIPPTTPEEVEESEEDDYSSPSEEANAEMSELLKKLIVKVKVNVNVNNEIKKKVKVKSDNKVKA